MSSPLLSIRGVKTYYGRVMALKGVDLQGLAASYFSLLRVQFRPLGFVIGAEIVTWPQLMPGDVALFLTWQDAPADS